MAPAAIVEEKNGSAASEIQPPPGVIIPPPSQRDALEKTAAFIARKGTDFEERIRDQAKVNKNLAFINEESPFHAFYRWRLSEHKAGRGSTDDGGATSTAAGTKRKGPEPPPDFKFSARMPIISAVDFDIVKLTAIFVAKNGRSWMTSLSQKEASNPQFNFLRSQHSLNNLFNHLVGQYQDLLSGDSAEGGRPQKERVEELELLARNKYHMLEKSRKRAEWAKHQTAQKTKMAEEDEADKVAYAQVDWHDFVVVGTIEFNEADDQIELPPPRSLNDLQSQSLEQKAAASVPINMRLEETMPDDPLFYSNQSQQLPPAQIPMPPPPTHLSTTPQPMDFPPPQAPYAPSPQPSAASPAPYVPRQARDQEEQSRIAERAAEAERAQQAQAAVKGNAPMRIRTDYVPRAQLNRRNVTTALCPICKHQIPTNEFDEHLRIEQLDPRWREQSAIAQARSATTNLSHTDVANNLKRLASQRSDVFDPVTGQSLTEEEAQRRKRVELNAYDGTTQAPSYAPGAPGQGNRPTDVQEQLRQLQSKYGQG